VERYDIRAHRRLLVRPGMTGLWQVSGRSLLSWDETVRLDLYYVENWSFLGDLAILLRTFKAVASRHGAF
jgi:lipopolysaccharide/colanic/teichoic acid biosynthesis glycosyltransferase